MPKALKQKQAGRDKDKDKERRLCEVCREKEAKYHCPVDRAGYCSVPCFKKHKVESCSSSTVTTATLAPPVQQTSSDALESPNKDQDGALHEPDADPPMIPLPALSWPPDPLEEGLNALSDPLNRDEPKPLLRSELLAIATSIPMRQLLSTHPHLKDVLSTLSRIPNAAPRYPQDTRIRNILGLGESEGVPSHLSYRPNEEAEAARQQNGFRAGHYGFRGVSYVDQQQRSALSEFNQLVKQILAEERRKRATRQ